MIRVLHISDLHYHDSEHHGFSLPRDLSTAKNRNSVAKERPTMVDTILAAIENIKPINAIVVTGDLTWTAQDREFRYAEQEIMRLREKLNVTKSHVLLIPGNHDADWETEQEDKRFIGFNLAFKNITGKRPSESGGQIITIGDDTIDVHLIGVNSARIESKEDKGIGFVGPETFRSFLKKKTVINPGKTAVNILCMHHHLLPVAYVERDYYRDKRTSVTLDAKAILDLCAQYKVGMVLHGHQHQPSLVSYESLNPLKEENPAAKNLIWVSGAGSAGVHRNHLGEIARRHFQVFEFEQKHGVVHCSVVSFASSSRNEHDFEKEASVPITLNGNRTISVDWMGSLDSAQADFMFRLRKLTANEAVEIQHIGLDMFEAKNKLLKMLESDFSVTNTTLNLLVTTNDLSKLNRQFEPESVPHTVELMPGKVKESIDHIINKLKTDIRKKYQKQGKKLTVNIQSYAELPSIHGFSLLAGSETQKRRIATYFSFFRWNEKEDVHNVLHWEYDWGADSYQCIIGESYDPSSPQDMIAIFQGAFAYLWANSTPWEEGQFTIG